MRGTRLHGLKAVMVETHIAISPQEAEKVFRGVLHDIAGDRIIRGDTVFSIDSHPHNGERLEDPVGSVFTDDPEWQVTVAAIWLRSAIERLDKRKP